MLFEKNKNNKKEISFLNKQNREELIRTTRSDRNKDKGNLLKKRELKIIKDDGTQFTVKIGDILKCNYSIASSTSEDFVERKFFYVKVTRDFFVENYEFKYTASMGFHRKEVNIPLYRFILIEKHNIEHVKAITQLENNN